MTDLQSRLVAYVDGELDAVASADIERLLASDPQARHSVAIYRETATLLRAACAEGIYVSPVDAGRAGMRPRLAARARLPRRWWLPAVAVAAALVGLLAGYTVSPRGGGDASDFLDDVAEYHEIYAHETTHLAEVPAREAAEISRWLGGRLARPLTAPDLSADGLRFAGARMLVSNGAPVADLLYTRADGLPVALCITRARGVERDGETVQVATRADLRIAHWRSDGYAFAVVGQLTAAQARDIAERARRVGAI